MVHGVVINPFFDWEGDRAPHVPYNETVIYEAHVKGLTQLHPEIPEELRGTYAGLAHPAIIEHLTELGVTAIELMPVHQFVHDSTLLDKGLRNYWGYNTIGFFAPHADYAATGERGQQVQEFKSMVKALHAAGIEVILDVVYNHTAEGNHLGPTLSFKGIDNPAYYRLVEDDQQHYMDYTGTGNSLNVRHPHSLQLIMDSLRYWVTEMHVDGFRFDLAATLAREFYDVDRLATFFELVQQDPVVSQVKLIAEPWDVGPGGYQVGNFPPQWTEWNGKYRDTVRDFWRGEPSLGDFVSRLAGSSDFYEHSGRRPVASINFVTAHDGFTLRDLVSYNEKHNDANGEDNNDGESHNRSWNHGVEGPTDDPEVLGLRARAQRNFLATLLLSPGGADDRARRRARPHPAGQQQHLRPGLRAELGALGRGRRAAGGVHRGRGQAPQGPPDVPAQALLHRYDGAHRRRRAAQRHRLAAPRRPPDGGVRLEQRVAGDRDVPQRPRHRRQGRPRRHHHRRPLPALLQRRRPGDGDAAARGVRRRLGRRDQHRRQRGQLHDVRGRVDVRHADPLAARAARARRARGRGRPLRGRVGGAGLRHDRAPGAAQGEAVTAGGSGRRVTRKPVSTYRLQITERFDLFAAARLLPYLHDLGADWVYLSPLLAAEPGSDHGYDVVAHDHVDISRGGAEGLAALSAEARRLGLGVLVDIVPNHVGVATPHEDPWWWDVLQHGRGSEHASAFDVDWAVGDGRIRIPVVGDDDQAAEGGPIAHLEVVPPTDGDPDSGELRYHDHRFPLAPGTADPTLPGGADPDAVHARQHYELVNWHVADDGLNYRRFFAVNTLAAVRVEDPAVFADSHVEIRRWFDEGLVDGLRVDHPDGLRDPEGYLADLAELTGGAYVLVEKILETGEDLLPSWSTEGTTGYDALAYVDRVLTDPAGQPALDALETRLRGHEVDWAAMIHDTKRVVADGILNSEVNRITRELRRLVPQARMDDVADAVAELLACFPVYRSYLPEGREHLDRAVAAARRHRPDLGPTLDVLLPVLSDPAAPPAQRFQQTSGMVMAKGVEDCAFYRWSRLTSLNEVGGDPSVFATDPARFHGWAAHRQHEWPDAMTCLSTHDTKRSEDVRARITVLAELPDRVGGHPRPAARAGPAARPRLRQPALAGDRGLAAPVPSATPGGLRERLHGYAEKAMREAGDRTTWTEPDADYESAVHAAVDAALDDPAATAVVTDVVARLGRARLEQRARRRSCCR